MKCPKCGFITDSTYCPSCGSYMAEFERIKCPVCGQGNNKDSYYCFRCGNPIITFNTYSGYNPERYRVVDGYVQRPEPESPYKKAVRGFFSLMIGLMIFLAVFYFIGLANNPWSDLLEEPPVSYNAVITTSITNIGGEVFDTQVWMALPVNCDTQQNVSIISINPAPDMITYDPDACTKICYWNFNDTIPNNSTITITQNLSFTSHPYTVSVDPAKIESYDYSSDIYKEYTIPSEKIESDDPAISGLAKEIVGKETNPYKKAGLIYDFVTRHITYEKQDHELGAKYAYLSGKGDCTEFATLFAAMCRSQGIPVRLVDGYLCEPNTTAGHIWTEFYIPPYGWVPADPTGDDTTNSRLFFGHRGSNVLILSKGNAKIEPHYPGDNLYAFNYLAYYKTYDSGKLIFDNVADINRIE